MTTFRHWRARECSLSDDACTVVPYVILVRGEAGGCARREHRALTQRPGFHLRRESEPLRIPKDGWRRDSELETERTTHRRRTLTSLRGTLGQEPRRN